MISSSKISNKCDTTCRMVKLFEKFSIEEQRTLARKLNDWEKRDQRCHPRISCSIITEYRAFSHIHRDTIKNISLGGAYIESTHHFPLNLKINQRFVTPYFKVPIKSKSQIIWTGPSGFAVQFKVIKGTK